ncbi:hypothetical protein H4K35_15065 [Myroides sp. NP-2]|uniref:hypothetical protein n=1 Tax=Myroides sp. NP-2 TaxID=2759945 RepID=UPI0015FA6C70|nr:hypothetical protein [Myroides sp. NP-2]MBB1151405.1 hypothetical protein [Myroides sp. NP-2]
MQFTPANTATKIAKEYGFDNANGQTTEKEHRTHNITYTQAGVLYFVGQESSKIKVQFFVGGLVVKVPACV